MSAKRDGIVRTLLLSLNSCSNLIEAHDYSNSEASVSELVKFLDSVASSVIVAVDVEESERTSLEILEQIRRYLGSASLNQEVVDAWAFELPKLVAKFGCVTKRCSEVSRSVIDQFVDRCNPRDMLSIFCEALGSPSDLFTIPDYFIPLLGGLGKVLAWIQRRQYEQAYNVVPVVLKVLKIFAFKSDDEDAHYEELFCTAAALANSILALEGKDNNRLRALLGLYILQLMALVSIGMRREASNCINLVVQLSDYLQQCNMSYIGLITGFEVDTMSKLVTEDDGDDGINCFSEVRLGAALAVIWGYKNSEVTIAAKADLNAITLELQGNKTSRWEALGMVKYIFSCPNLPKELTRHAIELVLCLLDGTTHSCNDNLDYSAYTPTLYASLQAIEMVIMFSPDTVSRRNAFTAFKKVLSDIPTSQRFDILRALINSADSSSMVAILLDCVKEEMRREKNDSDTCRVFWSPSALELVESILRPPRGGPPALPECSDAVLSALNLYRFILITESTGNYNFTGILSKDSLNKAYYEWLLPLRTLVSSMAAENRNHCDDEQAFDTTCMLNPVEMVLYRCIELVEEERKRVR